MAKTILNGALWSGPGLGGGMSNPIHSHAGRILAVIVGHAQSTIQTVTFYDALSVPVGSSDEILVLQVGPLTSPFAIRFPRDEGIPFTTGLCIDGANCNVNIWSIDYG